MHGRRSSANRQSGRRLRLLVRIAAGALSALIIAYLLVPLLIPESWLLNRISNRLTVLMNRQTTIDSLEVSYAQGLTITDLTIARREGFGNGALFKAEQMIMPLATHALWRPAKLLWLASGLSRQPLDMVRINNPHCWVVLNQTGEYNIADLNNRGGGRLPALSYEIGNLQLYLVDLRRADASAADSTQRLILPKLSAHLDPQSGHMSWRGAKKTGKDGSDATIDLEGDLAVPRLRSGVPLGGGSTLEWREVDLASLPPMLMPRAPIASISGRSSGIVKLELQRDMRILFDTSLTFNHPRLLLDNDRQLTLPERMTVEATGYYDANQDDVVINDMKCSAPGVISVQRAAGSRVALRWMSTRLVDLAVSAEISDASRVLGAWHSISGGALDHVTCAGALGGTLRVRGDSRQRRYELELDATSAALGVQSMFDLPVALDKRLRAVLEQDSDHVVLHDLQLTLGATGAKARGHWPIRIKPDSGASWWDRVLAAQAEVELDVNNIKEVCSLLTSVQEAGECPGSGSLTADLSVQPSEDAALISASIRMPTQTRLKLGNWLSKISDQPFSATGHVRVVTGSGLHLSAVRMELESGPLRISAGSDDAKVVVDARLPKSAWDRDKLGLRSAEVSLEMPFSIAGVDQLLEVVPALNQWAAPLTASSSQTMTGDISGQLSLRSAVVDKSFVMHVNCRANANPLDLRIRDTFRKMAGAPLDVTLDYTYDDRDNQEYEALNAEVKIDGGTTQARLERCTNQQPARLRNRALTWTGHIESLDRFLKYWPTAAQLAAERAVRGGADFEISTSYQPSGEHWFLDLDLSPMGFALADQKAHKKPSTPLRLRAAGRWTGSTDQQTDYRLDVDNLQATVAQSHFSTRQASATFSDVHGAQIVALLNPIRHQPPMRLVSCAANYHAHLRLDDDWFALVPFEAQHADWHLSGDIEGDGELRLENGSWFHRGTAALDSLALRAPRYLDKPAGVQATLEYTLFCDPQDVDDPSLYQIHIPQLRLHNAEHTLSVSGVLEWDGATRWSDGPCAAQLAAHFETHDVARLRDFAPAVTKYEPSGTISATLQIADRDRRWRAERGDVVLDQFSTSIGGHRVTFDGLIELDADHVGTDALFVEGIDTRALIIANVPLANSNQPSIVHAAIDAASATLHRRWTHEALSALPATVHTLSAGMIPAPLLEELLWQRPLEADVYLRSLDIAAPLSHLAYTLSDVHARFSRRGDEHDWHLTAALDGGLLNAHIDRRDSDLNISYELLSMCPTPAVVRQLRFGFPGLRPEGTLDYRWQLSAEHAVNAQDTDQPLATGDLTIAGGKLLGKAAPGWMTTVFPKLDLAKFSFTHMHDWFSIFPDGRVRHQALFDGKYYNLYADGWALPDHSAEHVIGIDLLAGFDSKAWTQSSSGKIPLFKSISRLNDDAELIDEQVRYVPVEFVKALLVDNNPLTAAYRLLKRRISREK